MIFSRVLLPWRPGEEKKCEKVKEKFEQYFIIKRNVMFERAKLNMGKQKPGEPVDVFITDLYCLSKHCEFGALEDELVGERIVVGLQNVKFSEKLQVGPSLTLQSAINTARQNEWVKKQLEILRSRLSPAPSEVKEVNKANGKQERRPRKPKYRRPKHVCVAGNASENNLPQKCPAKDAT